MHLFTISYKTYRWSILGTILSIFGAILKAFFWMCMFAIISILYAFSRIGDQTYYQIMKFIIPISVIMGIVSLTLGIMIQKKAVKISSLDFEKMVKSDVQFAKKMARKNPENKEWFINLNPEYAEYVSSGKEALDRKEILEPNINDINDEKQLSVLRQIIGIISLLIVAFASAYFFGAFNQIK